MFDYNIIKENKNKEILIKKNSVDSWRLGEIMKALGFNKESKFTWTQWGLDTRIDSGFVIFDNNCKVSIK